MSSIRLAVVKDFRDAAVMENVKRIVHVEKVGLPVIQSAIKIKIILVAQTFNSNFLLNFC
jgi:hypothetical protein